MSDQKVPPTERLITNQAQKAIGLLHQLGCTMDLLHTTISTGDDQPTEAEVRLLGKIIIDTWALVDHDLIKGVR